MLAHFNAHTNEMIFKQSVTAAVSLPIFYFFMKIARNYCNFLYYKMSVQISVALSSLIYRKLLRLKSNCISNGTFGDGGNIVTLITKDVFMFGNFMIAFPGCISFVITFFYAIYIVYAKIGTSGLTAFGVIFATLLLQGGLSILMLKKRIKVDLDTAKRVEFFRETLSAIESIKMFNWEQHFIKKIDAARNKEIGGIFTLYIIKFFIWFLGILSLTIPFYIILIVCFYIYKMMSIADLLYIMLIFFSLRTFLIQFLPNAIGGLAEMVAAIRRIQNFLKLEETCPQLHDVNSLPHIFLDNVNLEIGSLQLKNISLRVENKGLVLLTGCISAGKSALLKSIMGEILLQGSYKINGRLSYASQEPWIFPSTIKQNILFGEDFNHKRYHEVLNICALSYDLRHLDKGDETILIDGGANISKGQQARINLARAIYRKADIYLLDDCLNALDEKISLKVFKDSTTFLKDSIVLMVTQNPEHLKCSLEDTQILLIQNGNVSLVENCLGNSSSATSIFIDDTMTDDFINEKDKSPSNGNTISDTNESERLLEQIPQRNIYYENTNSGIISGKVFKNYISYFGGYHIFILIVIFFCVFEISNILCQKSMMHWINTEEQIINSKDANATTNDTESMKYNENLNKRIKYFITYNTTFYCYIVFGVIATLVHFLAASKASIKIHKLMTEKVIRAHLKFFDTNLFGNIINRFSKDVYSLDEYIPFSLFQVFMYGLEVLGTLVLIAMSNWILLTAIILIYSILFTLIRYIFLPVACGLKRLESAVHSSMVGHLNSSIEGLFTIRVHGNENLLKQEFDSNQDRFASAYFINVSVSTGFGLGIDMFTKIIVIMIYTYFYVENNITVVEVGVILSLSGRLIGIVRLFVQQLLEFLVYMTSAERTLNYTEIQTENQNGIEIDNWPNEGNIVFDKVSLTYFTNTRKILEDLNLSIKARAKIGIIGRTGSGKSSLIRALFRLYTIQGRIFIDYADIKYLSLMYRSKIGIVSQKPFMFSGTIRENLDPENEFTDEDLWNVLNRVKLSVNLYDNVVNLNLSTGQKQLICLARVLLTKKKIVVLDEVTSDLDEKTEAYICEIIRDSLKNCTVLIITHKPEILKQVDEIFILNNGCLNKVK